MEIEQSDFGELAVSGDIRWPFKGYSINLAHYTPWTKYERSGREDSGYELRLI